MASKQQKGALLNPISQNDPKVRRFGLRKVQLRIYGLAAVLILTLILIGILEYVNRTLPGGSKTRYSAGLSTRDLSGTKNHPVLAIRDDPSPTTTQAFVPLSTTATITNQCPSLPLTCSCPADEIQTCNCTPDPTTTFCTCVIKVLPSCGCDPSNDASCECGPDPYYRDCVCPPDSMCNRCMCPSSSGSYYEPCDCPADPFGAGCSSSPREPVCGEGSLQECGCSVVEEWRCGANVSRSDCTAAATSVGGVFSSIVTVVPVFSTANSSIASPSVEAGLPTSTLFTTNPSILTPSSSFFWSNTSRSTTVLSSPVSSFSDVVLTSSNGSSTLSPEALSPTVLSPSDNTVPTSSAVTAAEPLLTPVSSSLEGLETLSPTGIFPSTNTVPTKGSFINSEPSLTPVPSPLDGSSPFFVASTSEPTSSSPSSVVPVSDPSDVEQSPTLPPSDQPSISVLNSIQGPSLSSQALSSSALSQDPSVQSSGSPTANSTPFSTPDLTVESIASTPAISPPIASSSPSLQTLASLSSSTVSVQSEGPPILPPSSSQQSLFLSTGTPTSIITISEIVSILSATSTASTSPLGVGAIILVSSSLVTLSSGPVSFSAVAVTFFQTTPTGSESVITDSSGNVFTIPSQILVSSPVITPTGSTPSSLTSDITPAPPSVPVLSIPKATISPTLVPILSGSVASVSYSPSSTTTEGPSVPSGASIPLIPPTPPGTTEENLNTGIQSSLQPTGSSLVVTAQTGDPLSGTAAVATSSLNPTSPNDPTRNPKNLNPSILPQSISAIIPAFPLTSQVNSNPGSNPDTISQTDSGSGPATIHASAITSITTPSADILSLSNSAAFSAIPISQDPSNTSEDPHLGSPTSRGGSSGISPPTSSPSPGSGSGSITVAIFSWPVSKTVLGGYVPIVLGRLVLWAWTTIYEPLGKYETFRQLSRHHGAPSSILFGTGLSLWYVWPGQIAAWLISPFAAELVYFDTNYGCANPNLDTPANPCWPPKTSVNSWVVRVLETLLSAVALTVVVIIALWFKRPAGRAIDPASIAAVAAVMGHPEVERDFKSFDSEMSTKDLKHQLRYKQYQLGTYQTETSIERYGIIPAVFPEQENHTIDSLNSQNGLPSATTVSKMKMAFTSVKNWKMFQMRSDIVFLLYLFGLIGAGIMYMSRIDNLTSIHLLDNSSVGRRILFAFLACVACSYWTRLQRDGQTLAPYAELAYPNEAAPSPTILLRKRSLALVAIFPLFRHFHIVAGCTALTAVLSEFLVITFSGLPYRPGQLRSEFLFCGITSLVLLVIMLFMLVVVNVWRMLFIPHLPRKPDNMAAIMTYVCDSKMNDDFEGLEKVDVKERDKRIVGLRKRYRYGERKCQDGRRRWVVDEIGDRIDSET